MNDSENFEQLRRLLALKRHESPPPGYFNRFSRGVIARINAGEQGGRAGAMDWLNRLRAAFETRPVFAGAFGAAVCTLLISGIFHSDKTETLSVSAVPTVGQMAFAAEDSESTALNQPGKHGITISSSTTPIMMQANSFFGQYGNGVIAQPVNFNPGGN